MIYCSHCAKENKDGATACVHCGSPLEAELKEEELRPLVQTLHKKSNHYRNFVDEGLSSIVIGGIFLITGLLFYYLSIKTKNSETSVNEKIHYVDTACPEFWTFVVFCAIGGTALAIGLFLALYFGDRRRFIHHDIEEIRKTSSAQIVDKTPLIAVVAYRAIAQKWHSLSWRMKQRRAAKKGFSEGK